MPLVLLCTVYIVFVATGDGRPASTCEAHRSRQYAVTPAACTSPARQFRPVPPVSSVTCIRYLSSFSVRVLHFTQGGNIMAINHSSKRPATTLRCGNIKTTIWQNVSEKARSSQRPFRGRSRIRPVPGARDIVRSQRPGNAHDRCCTQGICEVAERWKVRSQSIDSISIEPLR